MEHPTVQRAGVTCICVHWQSFNFTWKEKRLRLRPMRPMRSNLRFEPTMPRTTENTGNRWMLDVSPCIEKILAGTMEKLWNKDDRIFQISARLSEIISVISSLDYADEWPFHFISNFLSTGKHWGVDRGCGPVGDADRCHWCTLIIIIMDPHLCLSRKYLFVTRAIIVICIAISIMKLSSVPIDWQLTEATKCYWLFKDIA